MRPDDVRRQLLDGSYCPIPLNGKRPVLDDWQRLREVTPDEIQWWSRTRPAATNTGVLTRLTPTLDTDILDEDAAKAVERLVRERFEDRGRILVRFGKRPKRAILFRTDAPFPKLAVNFVVANGAPGEKLELLCDGQQVVVDGVHPDTQRPYEWFGGSPLEIPRDHLPSIDAGMAKALVDAAAQLLVEQFGYRLPSACRARVNGVGAGNDRVGADWQALFDDIREGRSLHDSLRDLAAKMVAARTNPGAVVKQLRALMEASTAPHDDRWKARFHDIPRLVDSADAKIEQDRKPAPVAQLVGAGREDRVALQFAARHKDDYRYVALTGKWLIWAETRWRVEDTLAAFDAARKLCREEGKADAKVVAAVEKLARSDRRMSATVEQFDADPWLLATPSGTVDLKTGQTRPARREDYITKMTAVAPAPRVEEGGSPPDLWLSFLDRVFNKNGDLIAFMRRFLGYCLSADISEHVFCFLFGTGRNGKGTFVRTATGVIGDYANTSPIEAFLESKYDRHPTELARLRKIRLTVAQETPKGQTWDEAKIKNTTGGDPITARFMRQDFFDYDPTHKLIIAGNHKPKLKVVDEAIRARLRLIPFIVTIPEAERDPELTENLKAEWPKILRWMIDGCLDWQANGLGVPLIVREASDDYFHAQDAFAHWLDDCCERRQLAKTASSTLFASWEAWATARGIDVGSERAFAFALQDRGWTHKRTERGRVFRDLILKPKFTEEADAGGLSGRHDA